MHEIRDLCWDGIPYRGASWLREVPTGVVWKQIVLVPACGGLLVAVLNYIRASLQLPAEGVSTFRVKDVLEPILRTLAACVTLGTGNSLGPEGPSVEIGSSIANGVGVLFDKAAQSKLSLRAAGSAAGIASGWSRFIIIFTERLTTINMARGSAMYMLPLFYHYYLLAKILGCQFRPFKGRIRK